MQSEESTAGLYAWTHMCLDLMGSSFPKDRFTKPDPRYVTHIYKEEM